MKNSHQYYYQIQGQLNITQRNYCDLVVYNEFEIYIERIYRDQILWEGKMLEKINNFYFLAYLPELIFKQIPKKRPFINLLQYSYHDLYCL